MSLSQQTSRSFSGSHVCWVVVVGAFIDLQVSEAASGLWA